MKSDYLTSLEGFQWVSIFLKLCSIFSVVEKVKNSVFENPIISQTLSIKNYIKIKNVETISLHIIRNLMKKSFKMLLVETMFTLTVFQILLFEVFLVLRPTQRFPGIKLVKFNWKTKKNVRLLVVFLKKWLCYKLRGFRMVFASFCFILLFILFKSFSAGKIEKL